MSNAPFDHRLVIERLKEAVPTLREVGTAADFKAVQRLPDFPAPAAYVLLAEEAGEPKAAGNSTGAARQRVGAMFGVVLAVRSYRYDQLADAADDLGSILDQVRGALVGWTPNLPMARGTQFVTGKVLDSDDTTLLWGEIYSTQHSIGRS
ncbi:hypothetical protein [Pseudomonas nitroreducens]|uniref:phage tail terminator protein n=1 Tax=Pseudomonas nitroreducens TaxID=46680 RepID=UPI002FE0CEF6